MAHEIPPGHWSRLPDFSVSGIPYRSTTDVVAADYITLTSNFDFANAFTNQFANPFSAMLAIFP